METPALLSGVSKLAIAGERAGFTIDQMIRILNTGCSVEELVDLIEYCLQKQSVQHCAKGCRTYTA